MPKRVPVNTIIVKRDGKNFVPPIGKPFDFTQEELNDINAVMPGAVRHIINEAPEQVEVETKKADEDTETKAKTTGRRTRGQAQAQETGTDANPADGEGDL